jgi:predicted porin
MKKTIVALAVAAAFSSTAFADNANVTVYGKVGVNFESVTTDNPNGTNANLNPATVTALGANPKSLTRIASNASRFGVKGSEDLGEGLSGIYQYEVEMDANGQTGVGFGKTRNSGVGVKSHDYGTVMMGIWDTPFKLTHNKIELFDNTHFASAINLMGRSAATTAITAATAPAVVPALSASNAVSAGDNFNTRQKQVIQYWSPNIGGFEAKIAYGADHAAVDANTVVGATSTMALNKAVLSMSGTYENDMFYAAAGYESHADAVSQAQTAVAPKLKGNNTAVRLVGQYKLGTDGWIGAAYENASISVITTPATAAAAVITAKRSNFELAGLYKMGPHNVGATFVKAGDLGSFKDTGATQLSLRYGFNFSKRTEAFAMYSAVSNKTYGQYNFSAGNTIASSAGAKLSGFGAGVIHSF